MAELETAGFAVSALFAVFAIVNPVGGLVTYVTLTQGYTPELKRRVIRRVVIVATGTLLLFAFLGNQIFSFFSLSIPAFRIAGGIVLFMVAYSMMRGEPSKTQVSPQDEADAMQKEAVGVVPLGIPMFAGPGAITTVIGLMAEATVPLDLFKIVAIVAAILATMGISWVLLWRAEGVFARMGRMGAYAFSRIMGLLLAAVAVQFVILGIDGAITEYWLP